MGPRAGRPGGPECRSVRADPVDCAVDEAVDSHPGPGDNQAGVVEKLFIALKSLDSWQKALAPRGAKRYKICTTKYGDQREPPHVGGPGNRNARVGVRSAGKLALRADFPAPVERPDSTPVAE